MTIHFVYATIPGNRFFDRLRGKAARALQGFGAPISYVGNRVRVDTSAWPFRAPLSITHHVLQALRTLGPVKLYDWSERLAIRPEPGDILIGHPYPGDPSRVWNRACLHGGFKACLALVPVHHGMPEICLNMEDYISRCDHLLGITGPYWWDTWEQGAFAHWKQRMTPVDMAINIQNYPRVKVRFNPPGRRKFLFIGNGAPYKGAHLLSLLFGLAIDQHCVWVGADRNLPNLERRPAMSLTGDSLKALVEENDFFVTMGVSDANPTTILEAMAWGLPVACTPQSGYDCRHLPELHTMSTTDMALNMEVLRRLQRAPDVELLAAADRARAQVERDYTFDHFTRTVLEAVKSFGGL